MVFVIWLFFESFRCWYFIYFVNLKSWQCFCERYGCNHLQLLNLINDYSCLRKCWLSDIRLLDELNLAYCMLNSSEEQCRSLSCYLFFQNGLYLFQISVCWLSFQRLRADLISPIHWLDHWEPIYHLIKCCVHQFRLKAENCCCRQDIVKELV